MELQDLEIAHKGIKYTVTVEVVSYGFYKKKMSSRYILCYSTALPERMKYKNAVNELNRRVNNTHRGMKNYVEEKLKVTNAFMVTLQISGYSESFRKQVALSAYRGVARMEEREEGGKFIAIKLKEQVTAIRQC